jgi:hypothetical protein
VTDRGQVSAPFAVGGVRVEEALGDEGEPERVDALREVSAEETRRRTPREAIAHLETLDEAILTALAELPAEHGSPPGPGGAYRSGTKLDEVGP